MDFVDYGLDWVKLKPGQEGDMKCFEIVDFEVLCPEEQVRFNREYDKVLRIQASERAYEVARKKMQARIRRIILGGYSRKYYWLPSLTHGRMILAMSCTFGSSSISSLSVRLGVYLTSLAVSHCLKLLNFS